MTRICEDVIVDYDKDDGRPIIEEQCYDDGMNDTISETPDHDLTSSEALAGQGFLQDEVGNAYKLDASGNLTFKDAKGTDFTYNTEKGGFTDKDGNFAGGDNSLLSYVKKYGSKALDLLKTNGQFDPAKLLTLGIGAYALTKKKDEGGYNVPVPKLDAVRQQIDYTDPNRRPGEAGRQYFTDPRYAKDNDAEALAGAQAASDAQAKGILAAYKPAPAPIANPYAGKMKRDYNPAPAVTKPGTTTGATTDTVTTPPTGIAAALPVAPTQQQLMDPNYKIPMAAGGIANPRYLQGATDGMADEIPSRIDGNQEAALSHGEFVIPADVVSHLGNGNSDAGAEKLYQMMARIRKARTGNEKQGKRINPDKFMPGGLALAYMAGGTVKGFDGTTDSKVVGVPLDTSKTSSLSPWAGDYVTNFLGQGAALAKAPFQAYKGPLTAGASDLQTQGFAGLSETAAAGYQPGSFTNQFTNPGAYKSNTTDFDVASANKYMNPYLQASLNPQIEEARRQSLITQQQNAGRATQAGAFGGGRQAIMDAETQRSLGANLSNIVGTGYNTAYDKATAQFNADQARKMAENQFGSTLGMTGAQNTAQYGQQAQAANEASRQYSADFGLKSLSDLMRAGETQRGITAEGIAADKRQFEEQQAHPYNMVEFQRKLVEGLPIGATTTSTNQDTLSKLQTDVAGLASLYKTLANLGIKAP